MQACKDDADPQPHGPKPGCLRLNLSLSLGKNKDQFSVHVSLSGGEVLVKVDT